MNDLVTLNLNIRQFAQDVIQYCEGPELLRAVVQGIFEVSVLDPTCGSGAFLVRRAQHPEAALRGLPAAHADVRRRAGC